MLDLTEVREDNPQWEGLRFEKKCCLCFTFYPERRESKSFHLHCISVSGEGLKRGKQILEGGQKPLKSSVNNSLPLKPRLAGGKEIPICLEVYHRKCSCEPLLYKTPRACFASGAKIHKLKSRVDHGGLTIPSIWTQADPPPQTCLRGVYNAEQRQTK